MRIAVSITKALADENRLRALSALDQGELCVCQIIGLLGLAPSTVSKHMAILRQAGLVESRKCGRWIYYRLPGKGALPEIRNTLRWLRGLTARSDVIRADEEKLQSICAVDKEALCRALNKN